MQLEADAFKFFGSRRWLIALVVSSVLCVLAFSSAVWSGTSEQTISQSTIFASSNTLDGAFHLPVPKQYSASKNRLSKFNSSLLLNGFPTESFRDNLRDDHLYVTSFPSNGLTNQVISYMNLIYLGLITERIPIVPRFTPVNMPENSPELDFGEVFDILRLQQGLDLPVLEWHQVKDPNSQFLDDLGCWNILNSMFHTSGMYHPPPGSLKLDISYTTPPDWVQYRGELNDWQYPHTLFWPLASLAFTDTRKWTPNEPERSPVHEVSLSPDEGQMLCYDMLYYVGAHEVFEFTQDLSPAWRFVGTYMHWNPNLERLAKIYIRQALGIAPRAPIPPYIAVHARRTDFNIWCDGVPESECYIELSAIVRRVEEVKAEIWAKKRILVTRVIITSDESNPSWWDEVRKLGWCWPDHSEAKTAEIYGPWHPMLIDAVIQSSAVGFVGTDRSTVSALSGRRVESWNHGVTRTVLWGKPGADDH
ncbi:hypothetical protein R3P38DRAFT_2924116 [Favolaschia claudopus]|uniref:Uncharacterized protein n=1 Tax=Favolaschia claudopus TaxID=2862362 RepID=A0AAW0BWY0_9AGAR